MDRFEFQSVDGKIVIYRFIYPYLASNMFVLFSDKNAVIFDPHENSALLDLLKDNGTEYVQILLTHEHYDHISGVNWLKERTGADLYCQEDGALALAEEHTKTPAFISTVIANEDRKDGGHRYHDFKAQFKPYSIKADRIFREKDSFKIGSLVFEVTSTPGHSPGSSCYKLNGNLVFTGDTLLQYDRVILGFRESRRALYEEKALPYLRSLSKDTIILPGHGNPFVLSETNNI